MLDEITERAATTTEILGFIVSVDGSRLTAVMAKTMGETATALSVGNLVRVSGAESQVYGVVSRVWSPDPERPVDSIRPRFEIDLIGELQASPRHGMPARFQRGVAFYPRLGSKVVLAGAADFALVYAKPEAPTIRVGTVHKTGGVPAHLLTNSLLGKHFAILGTTGSGKSCTVVSILRAVLDSHANGHMILLDPHNEYGEAFDQRAEVIRPRDLRLPFWLMNLEEAMAVLVPADAERQDIEGRILKHGIMHARAAFAKNWGGSTRDLTVDTPSPYYLEDLTDYIQREMGRLDKADGSVPYRSLLNRIESLSADPRLAFMFPITLVEDNLASIMAQILRIPVRGKPITIVDLSGVPSDVVDVCVSILCRIVFDFAVWSDPADRVPLLLVCEEAHRYVPQEESTAFGPTRRAVSRIAKEGRKYGLGLCLVTQRPSELSQSALSQCNTIISMRLANQVDQAHVTRALPDSMGGLIAALPALHTQEAVVVGEGVSVPMRLRFSDLAPDHRPRSASAEFSASWQSEVADPSLVVRTVKRWRSQR